MSYAGIARKLIYTRMSEDKVLIVGSGSLSEDLIKLLKKKHRVFITARNAKSVNVLALEHSIEILPWLDYSAYKVFNSIVNTIGSSQTVLFNHSFFEGWLSDSKLFIDLGSPSVINTHLSQRDGVLRLEDIFQQSAQMNIKKMEKIRCAKESIVRLCENRRKCFLTSHSFGREKLKLA